MGRIRGKVDLVAINLALSNLYKDPCNGHLHRVKHIDRLVSISRLKRIRVRLDR